MEKTYIYILIVFFILIISCSKKGVYKVQSGGEPVFVIGTMMLVGTVAAAVGAAAYNKYSKSDDDDGEDKNPPPPPEDQGTPPPPPEDQGASPPPPGDQGASPPPPPPGDQGASPPPANRILMRLDPCLGVVCQNDGTCVEGVCQCPETFSGDRCQIRSDTCEYWLSTGMLRGDDSRDISICGQGEDSKIFTPDGTCIDVENCTAEECCRDRESDEIYRSGTCAEFNNLGVTAQHASCGMVLNPDGSGDYIQTHFDPRGQCQDVNNCTRQECCKPEAPDPDTYCDNSEPDLTNAFMEDIPQNGCDGTSYSWPQECSEGDPNSPDYPTERCYSIIDARECPHTCNVGYYGGGVSCGYDGTYDVIPCMPTPGGYCSEWIAYNPELENICDSDSTKIFDWNGTCTNGPQCMTECCRGRQPDENITPGTCTDFSSSNPLFGCPFNKRFKHDGSCKDVNDCKISECCEDTCGGISEDTFPIPLDQRDKFDGLDLCDNVGIGEMCNATCNGNSALDDGSIVGLQYDCNTKGQTFGNNPDTSNPDSFDHRFCYRDGDIPPRTCADTTRVGNTGTKIPYPCPWWRNPRQENVICEDQTGEHSGCNINECCGPPISTTKWVVQTTQGSCTDTCNSIQMTCNTGDWGIHDEASFRNIIENTCTGTAVEGPVCEDHTVADGCPPGCDNDGTICTGNAHPPPCDWKSVRPGPNATLHRFDGVNMFCPAGCNRNETALNTVDGYCSGGYVTRPPNSLGTENALPVVLTEYTSDYGTTIPSRCWFNTGTQESSCDVVVDQGPIGNISRLCKCEPIGDMCNDRDEWSGESCTSTLISDRTQTPEDTTNCTLIPKDGTTPGSCDEVDPSVATCSYVPNLWELCAGNSEKTFAPDHVEVTGMCDGNTDSSENVICPTGYTLIDEPNTASKVGDGMNCCELN